MSVIEQWQVRPADVDRPYFAPSQTSYYATVQAEPRGGSAFAAVTFVAANGLLAWAEWSAHKACEAGGAHSVASALVAGGIAVGAAVLSGIGLRSKHRAGVLVGAILGPLSVILGGFAVMMWAPGWPAAVAGVGMFGALNGALAAVRAAFGREMRRLDHEAGMQHDRLAAGLEHERLRQVGATTRAAIGYQAAQAERTRIEVEVALRELAMHRRYPETFPEPPLVSPTAEILAVTRHEPPALPWSDGDRDDDLMGLYDALLVAPDAAEDVR